MQAEAYNVLGAPLCCPVCTEAYSAQVKIGSNSPSSANECEEGIAPQHPVVLIPCGHSLCRTCCSKVAQCPLCKRGIAHSVRNFALLSLLPPTPTPTHTSPESLATPTQQQDGHTPVHESSSPAWTHHPPALPTYALGQACAHSDHLTHWCVALGGSVCASCAVGGGLVGGHSHDCLLPITQAYAQQRTAQGQHESSDATHSHHSREAQATRQELEALVEQEEGPTALALTHAAQRVHAHIDKTLQQAIAALQARASLLHSQVHSALAQQEQHSQDMTLKARALLTALQAPCPPPPLALAPQSDEVMLQWLRSLKDNTGQAHTQALQAAKTLLQERRGLHVSGLHVELCPPTPQELFEGVGVCLGSVCGTALCAPKCRLTAPPVLPLAHPPLPLPITVLTLDYEGRRRDKPLPGTVKVRLWWEGEEEEREEEEGECSWDGSKQSYHCTYTPPGDLPKHVRVLHVCGLYEEEEEEEGGAVHMVALGDTILIRIERQCTGRSVGVLLEEGAVRRPMGLALLPSLNLNRTRPRTMGQKSTGTLVVVEEASARLLMLHLHERQDHHHQDQSGPYASANENASELWGEVGGASECLSLRGAGLRDVVGTQTTLYTTDQIQRKIHVLDLVKDSTSGGSYGYRLEVRAQLSCTHEGQSYVPSGLALWQEEGERGLSLAVGDVSNAVVRVIDTQHGHTRRTLGKGTLRLPSCVAVAYRPCASANLLSPTTEEGRERERGAKPLVFVGDQGLGCVLCLELWTGAVVLLYQPSSLPSPSPSSLLLPTGVALDNTRLYVTDWATGNILVFDRSSGVMLRQFGGDMRGSGCVGVGGMVALGDGTLLQARPNTHNIHAYR